ncbi:MAG: SDR family NAD(P)-dependent oxidoreductase [Deltaproteobacteria bacterium]|nr:SDR family NAD(P)-dependent oxidoreductase [Deltaproteobacteria bacterium]
MQQTILITGSTDGIGLETAKTLVSLGHKVLVHGRNRSKLERARATLSELPGEGRVESFAADLSILSEVEALAKMVVNRNASLDVLINNAGVYKSPEPITTDGLDVRFVVNTIAPFLLTKRLLPLLGRTGRVVNLSSAAQAAVDPKALAGKVRLRDSAAYAQSKLALTMWSRYMALSFQEQSLKEQGPAIIAVNPGSLLGTKMVKQAFGVAGGDIRIGAEILRRAALAEEFAAASGQYFDNDSGRFASPHPDALDPEKSHEIVSTIEKVLAELNQ